VPVSSGAKIAWDSGTENLDWTARVLARIVRFTQAGGVVNVVVDGLCVGAQSYWNAEATMLLHCRGALVMTPRGAMLLTGKRALEFAGSVSAEDNQSIGGAARIMGPNGEAQYLAPDFVTAYEILFRHYALTHVMPGEGGPRRLATSDPADRDPTLAPYEGGPEGFARIADLFDARKNPDRKKPFAIRGVMRAVLDRDVVPLERWAPWTGAESAVVFEGALGGRPVTCIGIESRPVRRRGDAPADGPEQWTAGTLFPRSSKKVARAIHAASGVKPVVVLANLSGFDGSPESLRDLQLEYGAEIGRAVVNFRGPIVFCVVSRYHGGAYVVFSQALNPGLKALALEGSYASVIGGAPAAAVVFPGLVRQRALESPAVVEARTRLGKGTDAQQAAALGRYEQLLREATSRAQAEVAREFDAVHSVERARRVGSLTDILEPSRLRAALVEALGVGRRVDSSG
jgi:acetyl-CoA carboxylase carboxyltransferase component